MIDSGWEQASLHILESAGRGSRIVIALPDSTPSRIIRSRLEDAARRVGARVTRLVRLRPLNPPQSIHSLLDVLLYEPSPRTVYVNASPALASTTVIAALLASMRGVTPALLLATGDPAQPIVQVPTRPLRTVVEGLPQSLERIARLVYEKARRVEDIVEETGLRETTVRKKLSRLRALGLVARRLELYAPTPWLAVYAALRGWSP